MWFYSDWSDIFHPITEDMNIVQGIRFCENQDDEERKKKWHLNRKDEERSRNSVGRESKDRELKAEEDKIRESRCREEKDRAKRMGGSRYGRKNKGGWEKKRRVKEGAKKRRKGKDTGKRYRQHREQQGDHRGTCMMSASTPAAATLLTSFSSFSISSSNTKIFITK